MVRLHLKPGLEHHRLTKLTPAHIDDFIATKREQKHGRRNNKWYSPDSLRLMRATLRKALQDAEAKGLVSRNVAAHSEPIEGRKRAEKYLTLDEARRLLAAVASHRLRALYIVALTLGLRRGEVLGLKWEDVDLDSAQVIIRRSLKESAIVHAPTARTPTRRRPDWSSEPPRRRHLGPRCDFRGAPWRRFDATVQSKRVSVSWRPYGWMSRWSSRARLGRISTPTASGRSSRRSARRLDSDIAIRTNFDTRRPRSFSAKASRSTR
jgi:integrase